MQHVASTVHSKRAFIASLPFGSVVSVTGKDAVAIVNNLTTNDIRKLPIGGVCESFVTDARGWVVAHGMVVRLPDEILLVGQFPQPDAILRHVDRYIVREDATPTNRSEDLAVYLLDGSNLSSPVSLAFGEESKVSDARTITSLNLAGGVAWLLNAAVASANSRLAVVPASLADDFRKLAVASSFEWSDRRDELELLRIASFWPLAGREILEKSLPQELDRDAAAISFTKGCYLGQETVARLDARGQLQKKLCLLRVWGEIGGDREVERDGKPVGNITSSGNVLKQGSTLALAYLKRGNFDPGTKLQCGELRVEVVEQTQRL